MDQTYRAPDPLMTLAGAVERGHPLASVPLRPSLETLHLDGPQHVDVLPRDEVPGVDPGPGRDEEARIQGDARVPRHQQESSRDREHGEFAAYSFILPFD